VGNFNVGSTSSVTFQPAAATSAAAHASSRFRTLNGAKLTAKKLNITSTNANQMVVTDFSGGDSVSVDSLVATSMGTDSVIPPSVVLVAKNIALSGFSGNDYWNPRTGLVKTIGSSTIDQGGNLFYDMELAAGAGNKDTIKSRLRVSHNLTLTSGKLKGTSWWSDYIGHNLSLGGTDSIPIRMALFPDTVGGDISITNSGLHNFDSLWLVLTGSCTWTSSRNDTVYRVQETAGKNYTQQAGMTLTIRKPIGTDWDGTSGAYDTSQSTSAGNYTYDSVASFAVQYHRMKDRAFKGGTCYDTTQANMDMGHDSGAVFMDSLGATKAAHYYHREPSAIGILSAHPNTAKTGSVVSETLWTGGGQYYPESVSVDGAAKVKVSAIADSTRGYFSYTAGSVGTHSMVLTNCSGISSTGGTNIFTSTSACSHSTGTYANKTFTTYVADSQAITGTGFDSITFITSLPTGVTLTKATGKLSWNGNHGGSAVAKAGYQFIRWVGDGSSGCNDTAYDTLTIAVHAHAITSLSVASMDTAGGAITIYGFTLSASGGSAGIGAGGSNLLTGLTKTDTTWAGTVPHGTAGATWLWQKNAAGDSLATPFTYTASSGNRRRNHLGIGVGIGL
jgi:hypothetical protein